jgi:hypothetical protein
VLHIVTVHHKSTKWIDIQLDFIARNIHVPHKTYGCTQGIEERDAARFDVIVPAFGPHEGKLNYLATIVCNEGHDDDLLMFIDGDAFPIADPMPTIEEALAVTDLVAVRRDENLGDKQPHPCFAVTTVANWKRLRGDWSMGYPWEIEGTGRKSVSDVGGNLLYLLQSSSSKWTPLLRTNKRDLHPLFFAVYGDVVYHHGAGFRKPVVRLDLVENPAARLKARMRWSKRKIKEHQELSDWVFKRIQEDPLFYREVCGVDVS